jgi:two-component system sensor histidine kinase UhpB
MRRQTHAALARPVTPRTIGRVLVGGFGLVILLLLAAGLLGVRNIGSIRATSAQLMEEQVRISRLLDAVLRQQRAINAIYAGFARSPEEFDRGALLDQLEASDRGIERIAEAAADEPEQVIWRDLYFAVTAFSGEARRTIDVPERQTRLLQRLLGAHQTVLRLVDRLVGVQAARSLRLKGQIEDVSARLLRETAVLLGAGLALAIVFALITFRLTVKLIGQLEWQTGELSRVSWHLLEKQETTARRFSHELHDELGQTLTALKANLVSLGQRENSEGRAVMEDCLSLTDGAIKNVRELSQLLRPTILDDFGLEAGLRWLCDRFQTRTGIKVSFESSLSGRLTDELETHIFRIAQEALTNVARHSKAAGVEVKLSSADGHVKLVIADNGRGFEPRTGAGGGLGMVGMRARARSAGGELKVETAAGKGVRIEVRIPYRARKESER